MYHDTMNDVISMSGSLLVGKYPDSVQPRTFRKGQFSAYPLCDINIFTFMPTILLTMGNLAEIGINGTMAPSKMNSA